MGKSQIPMFTNTMQNVQLYVYTDFVASVSSSNINAGNAARELPIYLKPFKRLSFKYVELYF